jgi:putative flippase GtrA
VPTTISGVMERLRGAIHILVREMIKFGMVGTVAFVVDIGLFNLLRFAGGHGPMYDQPLRAKILSVSAATFVAWLGNRYWTFRHRRRAAAHHELGLFIVFNVVGMLIAVACLGFSHYVLGLRSPLADNISANGVGLVLGTMFRFWAYRRFVFSEEEILQDTSPLADLRGE